MLWPMVSGLSIQGCMAPSLLGMWQGRNIMTEGHSKGKLFTSCRQGGTWENRKRDVGEDGLHPQWPSSYHPLASHSQFSCKLINGLIHGRSRHPHDPITSEQDHQLRTKSLKSSGAVLIQNSNKQTCILCPCPPARPLSSLLSLLVFFPWLTSSSALGSCWGSVPVPPS